MPAVFGEAHLIGAAQSLCKASTNSRHVLTFAMKASADLRVVEFWDRTNALNDRGDTKCKAFRKRFRCSLDT